MAEIYDQGESSPSHGIWNNEDVNEVLITNTRMVFLAVHDSSPSIDAVLEFPTDSRYWRQTTNGIRSLHYVKPSDLTFPKSQYDGWKPPLPLSTENLAIEDLRVCSHPFVSLRC